MSEMKSKSRNLKFGNYLVPKGKTKNINLKISETYTGTPMFLPMQVIRAHKPGPTVFLTGAVHGDELNGVGIIREIMLGGVKLTRGTLICIPIVNIFGFENNSRYLPDRRDLNRAFPGSETGSLTFRLASTIFKEVISKCDYGIDLHSAATGRINFPHVRGDFDNKKVKSIAYAFGCELIINSKGDESTLRCVATNSGCPTIVYEAGEASKFEPGTIALGVRGVLNVLKHLKMLDGGTENPVYQSAINKSFWIRANIGGILQLHLKPGDLVAKGDTIAVCDSLFSKEFEVIRATKSGIIIGMASLPAVKPGEPVCHIGIPQVPLKVIKKKVKSLTTLHRVIQKELASSLHVKKL